MEVSPLNRGLGALYENTFLNLCPNFEPIFGLLELYIKIQIEIWTKTKWRLPTHQASGMLLCQLGWTHNCTFYTWGFSQGLKIQLSMSQGNDMHGIVSKPKTTKWKPRHCGDGSLNIRYCLVLLCLV